MDNTVSQRIWKARNQILNILKENNVHIELGSDCVTGIGLWLCDNVPMDKRDTDTDASLPHYMELEGSEKYLKNSSRGWYYSK